METNSTISIQTFESSVWTPCRTVSRSSGVAPRSRSIFTAFLDSEVRYKSRRNLRSNSAGLNSNVFPAPFSRKSRAYILSWKNASSLSFALKAGEYLVGALPFCCHISIENKTKHRLKQSANVKCEVCCKTLLMARTICSTENEFYRRRIRSWTHFAYHKW